MAEFMKKTILMLAAFALLFGAAMACFSPAPKKDPNSPVQKTPDEPQEKTSSN